MVVLAATCATKQPAAVEERFCDGARELVSTGVIPTTTVVAPEEIRRDLAFVGSQGDSFFQPGAEEAFDEAEAAIRDYFVDVCGIDPAEIDALEDPDDDFFS